MHLNLGCGSHRLDGYVNIDRETACNPDRVVDLEQLPWPFDDDCAEVVVLSHTLEHLGEDRDTYLGIIKELYRICAPNAKVHIVVPHPRHDDFVTDPTHVRAILPGQFEMFSKRLNREWQHKGFANTPLGLYLDVDFELEDTQVVPAEPFYSQLRAGKISSEELAERAAHEYNVLKEIQIELRVVKDNSV